MTNCEVSKRGTLFCLLTLLCLPGAFLHGGWLRGSPLTLSQSRSDPHCIGCLAAENNTADEPVNQSRVSTPHINMVMVAHRFRASSGDSPPNTPEEVSLVLERNGGPSYCPATFAPRFKTAVVFENLSGFVTNQPTSHTLLILSYTNAPLVPLAHLDTVLLSAVGDKATKRNIWAGRKKNGYLPYLAMVNHYLYARSQRRLLKGSQDVMITQFFGAPRALLEAREERIRNSTVKTRWRKPHFIKLLLLEAMLPLAAWILWMDQDAFFVNWNLSLGDQLHYALSWQETNNLNKTSLESTASNVSMIFSITSLTHTLNNGVGFYRGEGDGLSNVVTRSILERVWSIPGNSIGDAFDNSAFNYLLEHVLSPSLSSTVRKVPGFVMNAYPAELVDNQWKRIISTEALLRREVLSKPGLRKRGYSYHDSFYREGDWIVHGPGVRLKKSVVLQYICFTFRTHQLEFEALSNIMFGFESLRRQAFERCDQKGLEEQLAVGLRAWLKVCGNWNTSTYVPSPGHPLKKLDY